MHVFSSSISERIKRKLENKDPDLILYLDNPYIEKLVENLIEVISEEIADILNQS